jgi:aflatoxin B1 aldehyde reductase
MMGRLVFDKTYRYWNDTYFATINSVREVAKAHDLTVPEVALRWISHHSSMSREAGDAVIIGASSAKHIEQVWWHMISC